MIALLQRCTTPIDFENGRCNAAIGLNDFKNGCRGLRKWVLKLKQGFAGVQKGVLKMKQGFAGCKRVFRIENRILQGRNGVF